MPAKNDPSAPRFDGPPKCLWLFFDEVEYLPTEAGLRHTDKIQQSLRYASTDDAELWNLLTVIIYTQHKPRNAPKAGIMQR
jgi:hypothetical protein